MDIVSLPLYVEIASFLLLLEWASEWYWLLNVTWNDISVIYVTAHRCASLTYGRASNAIDIS